jgi:hypothetical protein
MADSATLLSLPVELLYKIFDNSEPRDILALLTTCRAAYGIAAPNSVLWKGLCARYNVHDISGIPEYCRSYYAVYTHMLHAYGPLLGLWASDYPYNGAVVQLRWDPGNEQDEIPGILGEKWELSRFVTELDNETDDEHNPIHIIRPLPQPPRFIRSFKIAFDLEQPSGVSEDISYAKVHCYRDFHEEPQRCFLALSRPAPVTRRILLSLPGESETVLHPPFPTSSSPWLDIERGRRLRDVYPLADMEAVRELEHVTDMNISLLRMLSTAGVPPHMTRPFMYREAEEEEKNENTETLPSRSLMVLCPCYADVTRRTELSTAVAPQRLYPLLHRSPSVSPNLVKSTPQEWSPAAMEGLWLGGYGPHGTEVLYIENVPATPLYITQPDDAGVDEGPHLRAWKVTGDIYVPRGVQTWSCNLDTPVGQDELLPSIVSALGLEIETTGHQTHIFTGWATTSGIGFL